MEFKIIVSSRHDGPIDRYIMDLKNVGRISPAGCEMRKYEKWNYGRQVEIAVGNFIYVG